jgi:hypothetical protein
MTNFICDMIIRTESLALATLAYRAARLIDPTESRIAADIRDTARDNIPDFPY